jgi:26S proteasome regulatory subunit N1
MFAPHVTLPPSTPGLLLLWDVDGGLTRIDPFIESDNEFIKAGALLAIGIVNSTVRNEHEPALALLQGSLHRLRHAQDIALPSGLYHGSGSSLCWHCPRDSH